MIPFCEVLLHTYIDNLRQEGDEEREINHHGEKRKVETKSPEKELFKRVKSYNSKSKPGILKGTDTG